MLKEGFELLEKYKIQVPKYWVNTIPKTLEFPLVVKVDLVHKTDKNAVFLDIDNFDTLLKIYDNLKRNFPDKDIIIQKQIKGNYIELIIGIKEDSIFEKIVLVGFGGIYTEILKDYVILVPPFSKEELINSLKNLKLSKILFGYRNRRINIDILYDILIKLINLYENEKIKEIEINPLLINEKDAFAVDVRFSY
ncbi:MAG: acetate--CoA ligase family protein [Nanopusillaceae archaeon]